mmetsp:Transcript_35495/g.60356  ORF Transcript_35495/g.60356 Transcript_35495/m.60356 type:complete len:86 (-) Transcript_35495:143-400(-)
MISKQTVSGDHRNVESVRFNIKPQWKNLRRKASGWTISFRNQVHFEDSDLDSHHLVKRENVHVLFDLPDHEKGLNNDHSYLPDLL